MNRRMLIGAALGLCTLMAARGDAAESAAEHHRAAAALALAQGDGIAAEAELKRALAVGASCDQVAARMGAALLAQGDLGQARVWLAPRRFISGEQGIGFRALGELERRSGHLVESGQAYDQALRFTPANPQLWVEIARLRYAGGEQAQSFEAAEQALHLGPNSAAALQYRALLLRDAEGGVAALGLLDRALRLRPADVSLLADRGRPGHDLGRAREALDAARTILASDRGDGTALMIEATIAARASRTDLARGIVYRAGNRLPDTLATLLLRGVLELEAGNPNTAASLLGTLADRQPNNRGVQLLLARALAEAGDDIGLTERFAAAAKRPDAPRYLVALVARALENRNERTNAAALLERVGTVNTAPRTIEPAGFGPVAEIRRLAAAGDMDGARRAAESWRSVQPGAAAALRAVADTALLMGDNRAAADGYAATLRIRYSAGAASGLRLVCMRAGICDPVAIAASQLARFPHDLGTLAVMVRARANDPLLRGNWRARTGDWPRQ